MEEKLRKIEKNIQYIADWINDIQDYLDGIEEAVIEIKNLKNNDKQ